MGREWRNSLAISLGEVLLRFIDGKKTYLSKLPSEVVELGLSDPGLAVHTCGYNAGRCFL